MQRYSILRALVTVAILLAGWSGSASAMSETEAKTYLPHNPITWCGNIGKICCCCGDQSFYLSGRLVDCNRSKENEWCEEVTKSSSRIDLMSYSMLHYSTD